MKELVSYHNSSKTHLLAVLRNVGLGIIFTATKTKQDAVFTNDGEQSAASASRYVISLWHTTSGLLSISDRERWLAESYRLAWLGLR